MYLSRALSQSVQEPNEGNGEMPALFETNPPSLPPLPPLQVSMDNQYHITSGVAVAKPEPSPIPDLTSMTTPYLEVMAPTKTSSPAPVSSVAPMSHPPSQTLMTPYELFQSTYCRAMIKPSAPKTVPDSVDVAQFLDEYVTPEYRTLWYRSCYLPHRSAGFAFSLFNRGLGFASEAFRGILGGASVAARTLGSGNQVLRDMVSNRATTF